MLIDEELSILVITLRRHLSMKQSREVIVEDVPSGSPDSRVPDPTIGQICSRESIEVFMERKFTAIAGLRVLELLVLPLLLTLGFA